MSALIPGQKRLKRFKKRYVLLLLGLSYVFFNYSCLSMRSSPRETRTFFESRKVGYHDSVIQIAGKDLHYLQTGKPDAPTLVFVHGSPGSWDAWKSYLSDSTLREHFRLIAPDRPGFGYSDFRKSMDLADQTRLLNALLEELNNGLPVTLIGHSYGGPLIVNMALEAPRQYHNLAIVSGALDPEAEKPEKWRRLFMHFPFKYLVPGSFRPSNDELWWLKEDLLIMRSRLGELTQNVTIIHGTADRLVPFTNVAFMQEAFTGVESLRTFPLEEERHFIVWEREEFIKTTLLNWLLVKP